jgi:hypothetical protein
MAEDARKLQALNSGEEISFNYPIKVTSDKVARAKITNASSSLRNATICMLILKQPRNLKDGSPVDVRNAFFSALVKAEKHHVFSDTILKSKGIPSDQVYLLANFAFFPEQLAHDTSVKPPSKYLAEYRAQNPDFLQALDSHLLPVESDTHVWKDDFDGFIKERSKIIAFGLRRMVSTRPDELYSSTQPLEQDELANKVDNTEIRVRDFIDHRLTAVVGPEYWKQTMPGDVITATKELIQDQLSRNPNLDWSNYPPGRYRLDFCDVSHYEKIFLKNWSHFEEFFKRKEELQRHLSAYRILRNGVHHSRELTEIEFKTGEASLLWLEAALDKYDAEFVAPDEEDGDDDSGDEQE